MISCPGNSDTTSGMNGPENDSADGGENGRNLEELRSFCKNLDVVQCDKTIVRLDALEHRGLKIDQRDGAVLRRQHFLK